MGSSMDSGYYQDQAAKIEKTKCEKSKSGKHKWIKHGSWPSVWYECKHCKNCKYSK